MFKTVATGKSYFKCQQNAVTVRAMNMPHQCGKTQGKELVKYCFQGTSPCIIHNSKTGKVIFIQLFFH